MGTTRITVMNNGSLRVEGDDFQIVDQEGRAFGLQGRQKVSLCRCGQSSNKPFCDGTHKTCGWNSTVVAFEMPQKPGTDAPKPAGPGAPAAGSSAAPGTPAPATPAAGSPAAPGTPAPGTPGSSPGS